MQIQVPHAVDMIIKELENYGFEAYAVGGCVRDTLLGKEPKDWDITTSAKPEQVKEIFKRTIDTGIQHGTVTVMVEHTGYEVTTYRVDGEYEDGRHPKSVEFTSDLIEDLKRRDFTINAMAYSHSIGIVDEFGGVKDLNEGVIRCVGNPNDRFGEDALRILRAVRFAAQLGFEIEEKTRQAITMIAPHMVCVSKERIQMELTRLLLSDHPEKISMIYECGISPYICEHFRKVPAEKIQISPGLSDKKHLRWAAFLHIVSADMAGLILKELKMDNETIVRTSALVKRWDAAVPKDSWGVRRIMSQLDAELFDDLIKLKASVAPLAGTLEELALMEAEADFIRQAGDCLGLNSLAVNGNDLIAAGITPGKEVGAALQRLFELVLEHPEYNKKEFLLQHIQA